MVFSPRDYLSAPRQELVLNFNLKVHPPIFMWGGGWLRPWQFKRRLVGVRAMARARWHKATSKRGRSFDSTPRVDPLGPGKKNLLYEERMLPLGSDGVDTYHMRSACCCQRATVRRLLVHSRIGLVSCIEWQSRSVVVETASQTSWAQGRRRKLLPTSRNRDFREIANSHPKTANPKQPT